MSIKCAIRMEDGSRLRVVVSDWISLGDTLAVLRAGFPTAKTILIELPLDLGAKPTEELSA